MFTEWLQSPQVDAIHADKVGLSVNYRQFAGGLDLTHKLAVDLTKIPG